MNQDLSIVQLLLHASWVVQAVVALLVLMSIISWAASFRKLFALRRVRGWERAVIRGGVASTIGARFEGGGRVDNFATEVFVTAGRVAPGPDGRPVATVDVALIAFTGALAEGRYVRGDTPVLMTFEAVVERA